MGGGGVEEVNDAFQIRQRGLLGNSVIGPIRISWHVLFWLTSNSISPRPSSTSCWTLWKHRRL